MKCESWLRNAIFEVTISDSFSFLQVSLCKEISTELIPRVINVSIEEFIGFADHYRGIFNDLDLLGVQFDKFVRSFMSSCLDAAMAYKGKYFEDRSRFKEFTSTMVFSFVKGTH